MLLTNRFPHDYALTCMLLDQLATVAPTEEGRAGGLVALDPADPYLGHKRGVLSVLGALGAVGLSRDRLTAEVISPQAGYLLRLLSDLVDQGAPIVADWHREGLSAPDELRHPFGAATDLLAALELRRLELLPEAAPVRKVWAAGGVLLHPDHATGPRFLLVLDQAARAWQLPGGRRALADADPRATLLRELSEELGLPALGEPDDLRLEDLGPLALPPRRSPTYGLLTLTVYHLFRVHLVAGLPTLRSDLRWLSEAEVRAGQTSDGQSVHAEPLRRVLDRLGLHDTRQAA